MEAILVEVIKNLGVQAPVIVLLYLSLRQVYTDWQTEKKRALEIHEKMAKHIDALTAQIQELTKAVEINRTLFESWTTDRLKERK